jgi:hypothetical protein
MNTLISIEPSGTGTYFRVVRCAHTRRLLSLREYSTQEAACVGEGMTQATQKGAA